MRLTEINYKIQQLQLDNVAIAYASGSSIMLTNLNRFKELINNIEQYELDFYNDVIEELYKNSKNTKAFYKGLKNKK